MFVLERIKDIKHDVLKCWLLLAAVDLGSAQPLIQGLQLIVVVGEVRRLRLRLRAGVGTSANQLLLPLAQIRVLLLLALHVDDRTILVDNLVLLMLLGGRLLQLLLELRGL